jgi:8-oxo-dGTP pyrophosphatase MutT (NUDIX family)
MGKEAERIYDIVKKHSQSPVALQYSSRLEEGKLTRDENINTHFVVMFAAYDPESKQVFIGHHKKSGLWLFNGGHIDKGETPDETLKREMGEEWGLEIELQTIGEPKLITITHIKNEHTTIECKEHYDIWYFVPVLKQNFNPKKENLDSEFYTTDWKSIEQARGVVTDPSNLKALFEFEKLFQ